MVTVVRVPEALEAKLRGGDICGSRVWQKRWTIALLILVGGACGRKQKETSIPRDRKQKNFSKKKAGHVAGFYKCNALLNKLVLKIAANAVTGDILYRKSEFQNCKITNVLPLFVVEIAP